MFDFDYWHSWLNQQVELYQEAGIWAELKLGQPSPKPGLGFGLRTETLLSSLSVWVTGEADYDIMDLASKQFIAHEWQMQLDDQTFPAAFERFRNHVVTL